MLEGNSAVSRDRLKQLVWAIFLHVLTGAALEISSGGLCYSHSTSKHNDRDWFSRFTAAVTVDIPFIMYLKRRQRSRGSEACKLEFSPMEPLCANSVTDCQLDVYPIVVLYFTSIDSIFDQYLSIGSYRNSSKSIDICRNYRL